MNCSKKLKEQALREGKAIMDIKEIKREFGDCDWMRAVLNNYTVSAVLWLINRVEELENGKMQTTGLADKKKPGRRIKIVVFPDGSQIKPYDGHTLELLREDHGDWVVVKAENGKEVTRYNTRYIDTIVWEDESVDS